MCQVGGIKMAMMSSCVNLGAGYGRGSNLTSLSSQPPTQTMLCAPIRLPPPDAAAGPDAETAKQGLPTRCRAR